MTQLADDLRAARATCETCRWWEQFRTTDPMHGFCRRQAPTNYWNQRAPWPETQDGDWCGEHQPEPAAPGSMKE